jgi:hypothetical protein
MLPHKNGCGANDGMTHLGKPGTTWYLKTTHWHTRYLKTTPRHTRYLKTTPRHNLVPKDHTPAQPGS